MRDKVGPLEDSAGNNTTFFNGGRHKWILVTITSMRW